MVEGERGMKQEFYEEIARFRPYNEQEQQDQKVLLRYLETFDDIFERKNVFAHMTASPWIVNKDRTKVLMIYHNIFRSWGWCGGHCDGEQNCAAVALREGKEETGVRHLTLLSKEILAIDILPVPPHVKRGNFVSAHVHLNLSYLCEADEEETLRIKPDENSGVRWIRAEEIDRWVSEEDMKPVYHKLMEKLALWQKESDESKKVSL